MATSLRREVWLIDFDMAGKTRPALVVSAARTRMEKAMTPEERLEKIERNQTVMQDQIIVTARMQQEAEKRWASQAADVWEGFAHLARAQVRTHESVQRLAETAQTLADQLETLADRQATTQAALESLIATVDKFVKGQSGDGHQEH